MLIGFYNFHMSVLKEQKKMCSPITSDWVNKINIQGLKYIIAE